MIVFSRAHQIWRKRWMLRSIIQSIFFNFHYLPFKQAIKLPILLYKPQFVNLKGQVIISTPTVKTGMIRLGVKMVPIYPNNGIIFENNGGILIFKGSCVIGNNSAISIGKKARVEIGKEFVASTSLKIISGHLIRFGQKVCIGWECTFMDTDFHTMKKINGGYTRGYAPIIIGNNNWFGTKCHILKRTETPDYCTISATTLLNKKYNYPPYTVLGGNPASEVANGVYRDVDDDIIKYEEFIESSKISQYNP